MKVQETNVIHFTEDNLIKKYKNLRINSIAKHHFSINTIEEHKMLSKSDLVIYTNNKGVSKILTSRYFSTEAKEITN